jgi:CDP-diacylglycerol--glycerol-3-phosphate 3-phosphatidyltransferase
MTTSPLANAKSVVFNVPNQLTILRLVLAVVLFVFLALDFCLTGMVLFVIAAATDWVDGWYARKYGQVTTLGRILDPFADKVIVCGAFIFLAAAPPMVAEPFGIKAWMVVVVVGRELLVTALRSFLEERGSDFSAKMAGKLKMVLQCIAAAVGLFYLSYPTALVDGLPAAQAPEWCRWLLGASVWAAVLLTIYSGVAYVVAAAKMVKEKQ